MCCLPDTGLTVRDVDWETEARGDGEGCEGTVAREFVLLADQVTPGGDIVAQLAPVTPVRVSQLHELYGVWGHVQSCSISKAII